MKTINLVRKLFFIFMGASLAVSISGSFIFLTFGLMILILQVFKERKWDLDGLKIYYPLLIFIVWVLVTTLISQQGVFMKAILKWNAVLAFFIFGYILISADVPFVLGGFISGSVFSSIFGIAQFFITHYVGYEKIKNIPFLMNHFFVLHGRAVGTRSHPLTYAEGLVPVFLFLLMLIFKAIRERRKKQYLILLVSALLVVGGILLSLSRGVWLGLMVGILTFLSYWPRRYILNTLLIILVLLGPIFIFSPILWMRALSVLPDHKENTIQDESKIIRYSLWRQSLSLIHQNPMGGVGVRGFRLKTSDPHFQIERIWTECHNFYSQISVESGLIGLGLFLWALVSLFSLCHHGPSPQKSVFMGVLVSFLVFGITESWTHDKEIALIFWSCMGGAFYLWRSQRIHV